MPFEKLVVYIKHRDKSFFSVLSLLEIREDHIGITYLIRYSAVFLISHKNSFEHLNSVLRMCKLFFQLDYGERCATLICHDKGSTSAFLLLEFCGHSIYIFDMIFTETRIVHAICLNSWRKVWKWWSLCTGRVRKLHTCTLNV